MRIEFEKGEVEKKHVKLKFLSGKRITDEIEIRIEIGETLDYSKYLGF